MPFTLAHPAAVLVFARRPFVPSALVAGSVAPDLHYFVPIRATEHSWYAPFLDAVQTHSVVGMFVLGLPITAVLLGWYWLVRTPVAALFPGVRSAAAAPEPRGMFSRGIHTGIWLVISALIGLATHLLWDAFTHRDGYVVEHVSVLDATVLGEVTVARLFQYASSLSGLVIIAIWLRRRRLQTGTGSVFGTVTGPVRRARLFTVAALLAVALTGGVAEVADVHARHALDADSALAALATGSVSLLMCGVACYAIGWYTTRLATRSRLRCTSHPGPTGRGVKPRSDSGAPASAWSVQSSDRPIDAVGARH